MTQQISGRSKESFQNMVSPQFLLRTGGLPIDVVDDLRFEEAIHWTKDIITLENRLAEYKERLVDALHETIGRTSVEEQDLRRKMLALKRQVFNMKMPADMQTARMVASKLSAEDEKLLLEWVDLWNKHREKLQAGPEIFPRELIQKRSLLKKAIETPDFRKGILLASPLLDQEIDSYLAGDNLHLNRQARTAERSLLEYLWRTACKTSPFSTFTSVCVGEFTGLDSAKEDDSVFQPEGMEKRSFTRFNMSVLSRLSFALFSSPEVQEELHVQVTSGWQVQNERVRYLRRKIAMQDVDEEAPVDLNMLHEDIFYLPAGQMVLKLLKLIGDGRSIKLGELNSLFGQDSEAQGSKAEINEYLQHLLRLGLLIVPDLQLNIHSQNPLADYCKVLLTINTPLTHSLAKSLGEIDLLIAAYATASLPARRQLLMEIKRLTQKCFVDAGQVQAGVSRTLVYEDTTIKMQILPIKQEHWNAIFSDLAEFQQVLSVFDMSLPRKLVTRGYFQARYGVGGRHNDFLAFATEFNQNFFEYYQQGSMVRKSGGDGSGMASHSNPFGQADISLIDTSRQAIADYIREAYAKLPESSQELMLGDDFLRLISSGILPHSEQIQSHTFFAQFAQGSGEPLLIVNRVYSGLTLMFSRFVHCFSEEETYELAPKLRSTLEGLQPSDAVFAELKGGYDATNLNLHPVITPYELVCPGELSYRPQDEQIPLEDLLIQDDEQAGQLRLYSKRLGKEVIPLYLGFLLPMALPEIQQVLLNFSYTSMCPLSLWEGTKVSGVGEEITFYPRICYKHLVLQRAQWKIKPGIFPQRESGQSDENFFLAVSRWCQRHGLPSKVFVGPDNSRARSSVDPAEKGQAPVMASYKPLYVDFENYFAVSLLEATLRKSVGGLILSEMLPHRDQLWCQQKGHSYVNEFVFEMNCVQEKLQ